MEKALAGLEPGLCRALEVAAGRIRSFHEEQLRHGPSSFVNGGLGQVVRPLERVGLYIPGTVAIYLRQNRETGALGFIGFLLAFIAITLISGIVFFEAFINPVLAKEAPDFVRRFMAEEVGGTVFAVFKWDSSGRWNA